ncbi:MAG: biotin/lipoyl-binding protein [Clostridiales bacterium]|nr:biotin/lipoyl-binding protein [Clostridiales bacterium]
MKYNITINEKVYEVEVEQGAAEIVNVAAASASPAAVAAPLSPAPAPAVSAPAAPAVSAPAVSSAGGTTISSPLPGSVLSIPVKVGDAVKAGQIVALIEAMKMENEIPAPADGTVSQILVTQGASINTGDALIVLA